MKRLTIMLFAAGFVLSAAAQGPHHGPSFDEEGPDLLPPPQQHPFAPPDFEPQSPPCDGWKISAGKSGRI
jgi:hypothetical protein